MCGTVNNISNNFDGWNLISSTSLQKRAQQVFEIICKDTLLIQYYFDLGQVYSEN